MSKNVKVKLLESEDQESLLSLFQANKEGFAKFGEGGYIFPTSYANHADAILEMTVRPDDIWIVTYPRSGTTWMQEMVWLLQNGLDYKTAKEKLLIERYSFLEFFLYGDKTWQDTENTSSRKFVNQMVPAYIKSAPSPRYFKTHLPLSLLPTQLLGTGKVVYVARNPRDAAVSFFYLTKLFTSFNYVGDFKAFWNFFKKDLLLCTPYFSHLKEAWSQRHNPNMHFIFYEEMIKDLPSCIRRTAKFLGKEYNNDQYNQLSNHLQFDNFKANKSVNLSALDMDSNFVNPEADGFIRKGKVGGWREHFDPEMTAEAEKWIQEQLADTDIRFPEV